MELIQMTKSLIKIMCAGINVISWAQYISRDRWKYIKYIRKNRDLKNIHKGETIYILGNGPSVKSLDLSLLEGKTIMTVNKTVKTPLFEKLCPQYHCVIDRYILDDVVDDIKIKLQDTTCNTKFILHRAGIEKVGIYDNTYYVYNRCFPTGNYLNVELDSNASTFYNVLPFAALTAIYMGFTRIVLLGNDFSFFTSRKDQHYYDMEKKKERTESLFQDLQGCAIVLIQYETLRKYCERNGIEIVNATDGSLLDEIKQVNLENYI